LLKTELNFTNDAHDVLFSFKKVSERLLINDEKTKGDKLSDKEIRDFIIALESNL
jgi:hypothetical protein